MRVVIEELGKTFRDRGGKTVEALRNVSCAIEGNEFLAVVGPSGCGKTTLLHIVAGLLPPDRGQVSFDGYSPNGRPRTAVVFQDLALFPWRTVERNIGYGLEEMGLARRVREERVRTYVDLMGLSGFERAYPHQLSGGMKQRAALARALSVNPMLLLMDEPLSALDAHTRMLMQQELSRIYEKTRKSVLYITHYIPEAVFLADRVLVLSSRPGRVKKMLTIDLPRPRLESMKVDPTFVSYLEEIWQTLREDEKPDQQLPG